MGRLVSVLSPNKQKSEIKYDQFGNLSKLRLPDGMEHDYQYDELNRLVGLKSPQGNQLTYRYDASNRIVEEKLDNLPGVKYDYDSVGRLVSVDYEKGSKAVYEYNLDNELIKATRDNSVIRFGRDLESQALAMSVSKQHKTSAKQSVDALIQNNYKVQWFQVGTIKSVTYPSGLLVRYNYAKDGRLIRISLKKGKQSKEEVINFSYKDGNVFLKYPNGVETSYYAFQQGGNDYVSLIETKDKAGKNLALYEYGYDVEGNLIATGIQHGSEEPTVSIFAYDQENQLALVEDDKGNTTTYEYDSHYNRTAITQFELGEMVKEKKYRYEFDRLLDDGEKRYDYDAHGNIIKTTTYDGEITEFEYTPRNELKRVSKEKDITEYTYDALGKRSSKTHISDGKRQLTHIDTLFGHRVGEISADEQREYIYAPGVDELVAVNVIQKKAGNDKSTQSQSKQKTYYFHKDRNNSVVLMTDQKGKPSNEYAYGPYGESLKVKESKGFSNAFRYTGRYREATTELYDYRTRFYDPDVGRFTTEDNHVAFAGTPQSYNRYTYVFNNPIRYRDPNGEIVWFAPLVPYVVAGVKVVAISVGTSLAANTVVNGVTNYSTGKEVFSRDTFTRGALKAAILGGIGGPLGGKITGVILTKAAQWSGRTKALAIGGAVLASGAVTGASSILDQTINAVFFGEKFDKGQVLIDAIAGSITFGLLTGSSKLLGDWFTKIKDKLPTSSVAQGKLSGLFTATQQLISAGIKKVLNNWVPGLLKGQWAEIEDGLNENNGELDGSSIDGSDLQNPNNPGGLDGDGVNPEDPEDAENVNPEDVKDSEEVSSGEGRDTEEVSSGEGRDTEEVSSEEGRDTEEVSSGEGRDTEEVSSGEGRDTEEVSSEEGRDTEEVGSEEGKRTEEVSSELPVPSIIVGDPEVTEKTDDVSNPDVTEQVDVTEVEDPPECQRSANGSCLERDPKLPATPENSSNPTTPATPVKPKRIGPPVIPPFRWNP